MNVKTIAKNRTKLIDAILAAAHDFKCYSLDNHFTGTPMGGPDAIKPPAEWLKYELRIGRSTKLQQTGPTSYCVHVHSNLWYEFTAPGPEAIVARAGIVPASDWADKETRMEQRLADARATRQEQHGRYLDSGPGAWDDKGESE